MLEFLKWLIALLVSGGFFAFLQKMIERHDMLKDKKEEKEEKKKDKNQKEKDEINERLDFIEKENSEQWKAIEREAAEQRQAIDELRQALLLSIEDNRADRDEMKELLGGVAETVVGLAQDRIVQLTDLYTKKGYITTREKSIIKGIYEPYHDKLHGNHHAKEGWLHVDQHVEVVSEEEAIERDKEWRKRYE